MIDTQIDNRPEVSIDKQVDQRALVSHEAAHAIVARHCGAQVRHIELGFDPDGNPEGGVAWGSNIPSLTTKDRALIHSAGFAGEVLEMGEEYMTQRGFRGYWSDSKKLKHLGFDNQDQITALVKEAMQILQTHGDAYQQLIQDLLAQFTTLDIGVGNHIVIKPTIPALVSN